MGSADDVGPKKRHEKKTILLKQNNVFCEVVQFPGKYVVLVSSFGKLIILIAPEMGPWLSKQSEDQSGGPRTNL